MVFDREKLKELANETIEISKLGEYKVGNKVVKFDTENDTILFKKEDMQKVIDTVNERYPFGTTNFEVIDEGTVDAVFKLSKGYEDKMDLGVLNFASAYHPGGGFVNGAIAQEECIAQCSDLYIKQITGEGLEYYDINKNDCSSYYSDTMFMSNVVFFKDANFNKVENPVMCRVLTVPAVNMNKVVGSLSEAKVVMKNRMRNILYLFAYFGCRDIVLGAFGCGVFGNNPVDVSNAWYDLLIEEDMKKYFKNIRFSILDRKGRDNNFGTFYNKFKNLL